MSRVYKLLQSATATGAGSAYGSIVDDAGAPNVTKRAFQATGQTTSGSGAATITVEGSNDGANFLVLATITLTLGTSTASDGFVSDAPWAYVRANVTAISGTGAAVSVLMGV